MWFNALEAQKERPAVSYGAIDLHSMQSQVRIVTDTGEILDRRIPTTRDRLTRLFPPDRPMRILLEASTDSEWAAQCLDAGGHEVIVAETVPTRLATLTLPHGLEEATTPVVALLGHLNAAIETADTQVTTLARRIRW